MAKDDKSKIDIPASATSPKAKDDFVIHVMPKEFKGRQSVLKQAPPVAKPVSPPVKPQPAAPAVMSQPKQQKGRRSTLIFILVGIVIILLLLVGALLVVNSLQDDEPVAVPEQPVEQPDEPVEVPDDPVEAPITQGLDTDSDGLTDIEESLYGTDFRNPDTDADSFLDGNEVFHRYDPIGYAPSTLLDTGSVEIYEANGGEVYRVYYPETWIVQESFDPGTGLTSEVSFKSRTRASIHISIIEKNDSIPFAQWYDGEDEEVTFRELLTVMSKEGLEGYSTPDKLTTYLDTENVVYKFVYDLNNDRTIDYLQTFQMMVNSFFLP